MTHLLPDDRASSGLSPPTSHLRAVLPKPKSIAPAAQREVETTIPVDPLTRELFADPDKAVEYLESRAAGEPVVLLDVGGYFAPTLDDLGGRFSGRILGVVEDTENGHQRTRDLDKLLPGRLGGPLAAEGPRGLPRRPVRGLLHRGPHAQPGRHPARPSRAGHRLRQARPQSIARLLHAKGVQVTVYDIDPVRRTGPHPGLHRRP